MMGFWSKSKMWAYKGHPLYTFIDDKKAGDVTGDNKDCQWRRQIVPDGGAKVYQSG